MGGQLLRKNTVGDHVKSFAEVQVGYVNSLSLVQQLDYLVIEGKEIGQEPTLDWPYALVVPADVA